MGNLAAAYREAGKLDLALAMDEETLTLRKAKLGPDHPETLLSMNNLAAAYWKAGRLDTSIPLFQETLKLHEVKYGPDHPSTLQTAANLGVNYRDAGRLEDAIPLLEETLRRQKSALGSDNSATLFTMTNLAAAYWKTKQFDKSVPMFEDLLKRREAMFGRDNPNTLATVANLGVNYRDAGRLAEAIPLLEEAQRAVKKNPGLEWVTLELFDAYLREDPAVSLKHWAALIPTLRADLGDDHFLTIMAMNNRGYLLARNGQFDEAEAVLKDTIEREVRTLGEEHMLLLQTRTNLGELYQLQRKDAQAEELLRKCLVEREKKEPDSFRLASIQSMLGRVLAQEKKFAEAESLLLAGHKGLKDNAGTTPDWGKYYLPDTLEWLTQLYGDWGKSDEAAKWRAELESITAKPAAKP